MRIKRLITGSNGTPKAPKRITQIEEMKSECKRRRGGREEHISKCSFCDHRQYTQPNKRLLLFSFFCISIVSNRRNSLNRLNRLNTYLVRYRDIQDLRRVDETRGSPDEGWSMNVEEDDPERRRREEKRRGEKRRRRGEEKETRGGMEEKEQCK